MKRATTSGGPYATVAADLTGNSHSDTSVTPGNSYYYVVTALKNAAESAKSVEANAVPQASLSPQEAWRQANFGTTANSGDAADSADPDGDGWSNADEFASGTNPNDRASLLRITAILVNGNDRLVSFPTIEGKSYRLEHSENLGAWVTVTTNGVPAENIPGTGNVIQVTDSGAALETVRFYRVVVGD